MVDRWARELAPDAAAEALAGLLEGALPGTAYEVGALRLKILGTLGRVPSRQVDATLAGRLDPERPRPQRLLAIELIAGRPRPDRGQLEAIALRDPDRVVQERARWALGRLQ